MKHYSFAHGEVANVRAHHFAHRLHRRGRLRDLRPAAVRPTASGRRFSRRARPTGSSRAASAPATRCVSKRRCGSTATTSTRRRRPLEADLAGSSAGRKTDFIGAAALRAQKASGVSRKLVGLRDGRSAASRATATRCSPAAPRSGVVTSGTQTPYLKKAIGMAYVPADMAAPGTGIDDRHPRPHGTRASVVPMPFYKRTTEPEGHR